jgi:hypothetical protein
VCCHCKENGHYKSEYLKLKNKEKCDKLSPFSVFGVVERNYEGSELVLPVIVSFFFLVRKLLHRRPTINQIIIRPTNGQKMGNIASFEFFFS